MHGRRGGNLLFALHDQSNHQNHLRIFAFCDGKGQYSVHRRRLFSFCSFLKSSFDFIVCFFCSYATRYLLWSTMDERIAEPLPTFDNRRIYSKIFLPATNKKLKIFLNIISGKDATRTRMPSNYILFVA